MKPTTQDQAIESAFGHPVGLLHQRATSGLAEPALHRVMELRAFLAVAEEHLARIRDRVHLSTAPQRDLGELNPDDLRMDAQWLEAAVDARVGLLAELTNILTSMPAAGPDRHRLRPPPPAARPAHAAAPAPIRHP
ncbi:hypothetical protein OG304_06675 [Streptomyces sp. NBC_00160]|uniref:hypothetical protein n=1 Tax=Streptomyces sp. NBC_00160 TaxID=2903628 RepID=UPI002259F369|nr:hypothetical protein [Streptomyces sp. NBC_00160]MCX5303136.1 hypothetical protein [Streptomyces sp. NBC_00160]